MQQFFRSHYRSIVRIFRINSCTFCITTRTGVRLLTICLLSVASCLALYVGVASKGDSVALRKAKGEVTVWAANRGKPFLNLQDGRGMRVTYKGDDAAV